MALLAPDRQEVARHGMLALVVAIPLLLSTFAGYGIEAWIEHRDLAAPVNRVDMDGQQSAPVLHDGFIELAGWGGATRRRELFICGLRKAFACPRRINSVCSGRRKGMESQFSDSLLRQRWEF